METARKHRDFVVGFICQRSLNGVNGGGGGDNFLCMAPGVNLPPANDSSAVEEGEKRVKGDGKGQVWRDPEIVIGGGWDRCGDCGQGGFGRGRQEGGGGEVSRGCLEGV